MRKYCLFDLKNSIKNKYIKKKPDNLTHLTWIRKDLMEAIKIEDDDELLGEFSTLEELQEILSSFSESDVDVKWNNPYFKDIDDLIDWSEYVFVCIEMADEQEKAHKEFDESVQKLVEKGINENQAGCYLVNYPDDYICTQYNGGCDKIEVCRELKERLKKEKASGCD